MNKEKRRLKRKAKHRIKLESREQSIVARKRAIIKKIEAQKQALEQHNRPKGVNTQEKPKLSLEDHII